MSAGPHEALPPPSRPSRRPRRPGRTVPPAAVLFAVLVSAALSAPSAGRDAPERSRLDRAARENARSASASSTDPEAVERRRREMEDRIRALSSELDRLAASEHGLLGELNRLGALARLRAVELEKLDGEVAEIERRLEAAEVALLGMESRARAAADALKVRLRALYRQGRLRHYRLLLARDRPEDFLGALRAVRALASSDADRIADAREASREAARARRELSDRRAGLVETRSDAERARREVDAARAAKQSLLDSVRRDKRVRSAAIEELKRARDAMGSLAGGLGNASGAAGARRPAMDISRFRGLLKWPCRGKVVSGFGRQTHPRFQTMTPHDGLEISAPLGTDIRAVFDGTVGYVGWLSGYGLTVLIDHGNGYVSVYAHASALLVEKGEAISAGQLIGKVGDTGSLGGPGLYFEIRRNGKALNPALWLEQR